MGLAFLNRLVLWVWCWGGWSAMGQMHNEHGMHVKWIAQPPQQQLHTTFSSQQRRQFRAAVVGELPLTPPWRLMRIEDSLPTNRIALATQKATLPMLCPLAPKCKVWLHGRQCHRYYSNSQRCNNQKSLLLFSFSIAIFSTTSHTRRSRLLVVVPSRDSFSFLSVLDCG